MLWVAKPRIFVLASAFCYAQTGPAIQESRQNTRYQGNSRSLTTMNFDELNLLVGSKSYRLRKGVYDGFEHGQGGLRYELFSKWLIQSSQGNPKFALIYFVETAFGASSSQTGFVHLLALENGHLVLKQEFRFIPKGENAGCSFDSKSGKLQIVGKSNDLSPAFAPKSLDKAVYTWANNHFTLSEWQAISNAKP